VRVVTVRALVSLVCEFETATVSLDEGREESLAVMHAAERIPHTSAIRFIPLPRRLTDRA